MKNIVIMTGFNQYQGSGNTSCSGMLCDLDLNIVQHDEDTAAKVALILPYDHCPLESLRQCQCYLAQEEWIIIHHR